MTRGLLNVRALRGGGMIFVCTTVGNDVTKVDDPKQIIRHFLTPLISTPVYN